MIELLLEKPNSKYDYLESIWIEEECYRFYSDIRKNTCTYIELMDLWLRVPYCRSCANSDPFLRQHEPDITSSDWENDLSFNLGEDTARIITNELENNPEFAILCKKCTTDLRPWDEDDVYIALYHLEEHYNIPLITDRKHPSRKMTEQIINLYDKKCYKCNRQNLTLTIDHIYPKSQGGKAVFRNLQPLCSKCQNCKADKLPDEVIIYSDIYWGPYPSDGFEGLFW